MPNQKLFRKKIRLAFRYMYIFQSLDVLKTEVQNFSPPRYGHVPQSRILVIGAVGAGKSSFFNTVAGIFRGRVTRQAPSGSAENSITSQVRMMPIVLN